MTKKILFIIIALLFFSCQHDYTPKPSGYMRIDFPKKEYQHYLNNSPYSFDFPKYAKIVKDKEKNAEPFWINIVFPKLNGKIYVSYKEINNNLSEYIEDSRKFAYKHTVKADAINEKFYSNKQKKVYGILYDIKGNTASNIQFFLTDSTKHFVRGALYFNTKPNKDSLAPVVNFIKTDILKLIETFEWEDNYKK
ncbi:MAG: gliding motility lipoprotein GldD [Bacteroidetes bacterium]|nr:MAG: gliding motility lipoprotein GldD [Bacteroidota bacterium]